MSEKYEFILTDKMKEDRFMCGKDDGICKECSCHMGEDDCVFNHLRVCEYLQKCQKRD